MLSDIYYTRLFAAFFSGVLLSIAGSLCQISTKNELASPSTLGFDGICVLTIICAHLFLPSLPLSYGSFILFLFFFLFVIVLIRASDLKKTQRIFDALKVKNFIIFGLCINLFIGALFSVIRFYYYSQGKAFPSQVWFGSFKFVEIQQTYLLGLGCLLIFSLAYKKLDNLKYLSYGQEVCLGVGIDSQKVLRTSILLSFLASGIVISFAGVFSFIGLLFPHLLRMNSFFKFSVRREILLGPLLCGVSLAFLDFLCARFTLYGAEIPVGLLSGLIGPVILIFLLVQGVTKANS